MSQIWRNPPHNPATGIERACFGGFYVNSINRWKTQVKDFFKQIVTMLKLRVTLRPYRRAARQQRAIEARMSSRHIRHGIFFAINRPRWLFQSGESRRRRAAFIGIFFAINRRNMRWILVEIRPPDPEFFFVRVDPLPQDFTPRASLRTRLALYAHEVGREPMAIATAAAPPWYELSGAALLPFASSCR